MSHRTQSLSIRLLILLLTVVAVFLLLSGGEASGRPAPTSSRYTVLPGDTLWRIAREVAGPDQDVRVVIDAIMTANSLSTSAIRAGQILWVPDPR